MVILTDQQAKTAARALRVAADYYLAQALAMQQKGYCRSAQVMGGAAADALELAMQLEVFGNRER